MTDESTDGSTDGSSGSGACRRAIEEVDGRLVDLLSWILDTDTRARIYVALRQSPGSTSEEVAAATGLYPSTVREALAGLHGEGVLSREKRESEGAGNNPYEYTAIPPSELVRGAASRIQEELNAVFNLDRHMAGDDDPDREPVRIDVREE